jgi:hypothetical protein
MSKSLFDIILTLAVIAAGALVWGGFWTIRTRPADRKRGVLMLVTALVLLGNVAIVTWP